MAQHQFDTLNAPADKLLLSQLNKLGGHSAISGRLEAIAAMDKEKFIQENLETVFVFRQTLSQETDRGCALMAASFLENELERLLRSKLVGTKKQLDALFEFNGPLGTFSSKIKMTYSLGFLNQQITNDLELIRKVRNEFGHEYKPIEFISPKIKDRIINLKQHFYNSEDQPTPRQIFNNTILGVLSAIHASLALCVKFSESEPQSPEALAKARATAKAMANAMLAEIEKKKK